MVLSNIINYPIVREIYLVITVVIGVLVSITVIEMLTGGAGGN